MIIPTITKKQHEILTYLYQFRFLHTNHIQHLFSHSDKTTVKLWLKDLREKGYIRRIEPEKDSFIDRSQPYVYCLAPLARQLLKHDPNCHPKALQKVYKEQQRKQVFITHCLMLADIYLHFLSQKDPNQELAFFTQHELLGFDYFPKQLPSAYITLTTKEKTHRYFLEVFDPYTPSFALRQKVNHYIKYQNSYTWEAYTGEETSPALLFLCPTENAKKHIWHYATGIFKKAEENLIELYATTWERLTSNREHTWETISIEEG